MQMDYRDAIDEILVAAVRLRKLCEDADRCGRAGAAYVFYESDDLLFKIDTARDAIAKSVGIVRNTTLEQLGVCRPPAAKRSKKSTTTTTTTRSRR
jgi:hypothetical protein